ncbi:MAG: insulinase family protein, partial [Treponema sp.]|nr:insulinase family protein [Treponema sp.]
MMQVNQKYKGFRVLDVVPVPDCDSTGLYLVHEKTGMEVFHLLNDDEENTFAFIFATPNEENTGVAHIIEHSVLCGSKKYPLKDPFIRLENQSVNTYLNAYTTQDFTVFPVASVLKADYFNLMGVYADAVFFPLLKKEVFMQEGVRLEVEGKNKTISGVVYNEMKGEYSSFESIAMQKPIEALLAGTHCTTDFGGDPLFIPELTYKHFKEFHKKHYCAANCRVFLYGNIPTEEQLDFLDKNILKKISSAGKK